MGLVAASLIMSIVGVLINCKLINYAWLRLYEDPTITGQCYEEHVFSGLMALCDIALGILPIFMVCRLQMAWRMKAAILCILGLARACVSPLALLSQQMRTANANLKLAHLLLSLLELFTWRRHTRISNTLRALSHF
ncbi:hypothetical protein BJX65DRAFT_1171 [Aspergillus insuetus]